MIKFSWKELSLLFVYIAVSLITISDTGFQLLIMKYIGVSSSILRKIALLLLFLKFAGTRYTKKEFFLILPIMLLSLYNYEQSGNIYCIHNILLVACMKDIDYSKLFQVLFYSTFTAVLIIGILSFFDIGGVVSITQDYGRNGLETRYCFGLHHPNIWHQAISRCIAFFALGFYKNLRWPAFAVLFACNLLAYTFSLSRTGLLAGSIFLIMICLYQYSSKIMHCRFTKISIFSSALLAYASYCLMILDYHTYPTMFSKFFNQKLSTGRVGQAALYLVKNPVKLFGTRFPDNGSVFDCGFLRMLSESGYLLGGIFLLCLFALLYTSLKNNWGHITAVILMIILYSLYEVFPLTRAPYNIPVFYFGLLLYPKLHPTNTELPDE
jgi:hypothetical protein